MFLDLTEMGKVPMKLWTGNMPVEPQAMQQIRGIASLPVVGPHVAIMPDVHLGIGATVGSVVPTRGAIIPAAVGVDIGCGMMAVRTDFNPNDVHPSKLLQEIEAAIPHGGPGVKGSWSERGYSQPAKVRQAWERKLALGFKSIERKHPDVRGVTQEQLGTLGGGNHFIEVCVEAATERVWLMLHSGSRGVGNRIGQYFISQAKDDYRLRTHTPPGQGLPHLPDPNLAWLVEGSPIFEDYVEGVRWAQDFASINRLLMMGLLVDVIERHAGRPVPTDTVAVNCHHNYVQQETHFGETLYVTRKGAVSAKPGELGIIPGSMGAKSFIVRGLGHPQAFMSCSHGAGRKRSRSAAKRDVSLADHEAALEGVACRADASTLDETPDAYKDIDEVMAAQGDLVEVVAELKQIVCVKG